MIGTLDGLFLACVTFVGAHLILSSGPIRDPLVAKFGERHFSGLYSILVAVPFASMIWAYRKAPFLEVWTAPTGVKHISLTVMVVACIFAVASFSSNNPAVVGAPKPDLSGGPKGIFRITRHPFMWGVALWAITHLLANGDAASIILFGSLGLLAIVGTMHADLRKRRLLGGAWETYARQSSHLPFLAIAQGRTRMVWSEMGWRRPVLGFGLYLVLLVVHEPIIGVAPVSLVAGIFG